MTGPLDDMNTWNGTVHPAAEHSPMLGDEGLARLVVDIRSQGLRDPLTVTPDGQLLDGRNRAAACKELGITPTVMIYDGDPWAFVISKNIERRHVSTGSRAATVALMLADQGKRKGGRWQRGSVPDGDGDNGSSSSSAWIKAITQAGTVLDWVPDLLTDVINERVSLDAAFQAADKQRQAEALAREQERKRKERELAEADGALADYLTHISHLLQLNVELIGQATDLGGWESVVKHTPTIRHIVDSLEERARVHLG